MIKSMSAQNQDNFRSEGQQGPGRAGQNINPDQKPVETTEETTTTETETTTTKPVGENGSEGK